MKTFSIVCIAVSLLVARAASAAPILVGQQDTFEDGTTQGWVVSFLGASHPAPPTNAPTGGPAGVDDNFLLLTSIGGAGAGSRLAVINPLQWAGDYLAGGVGSISMDLINLGSTDLSLRLLFEDPVAGPPTNVAVSTTPILLAAGTGWMHATFYIGLADLTALVGDTSAALSGTTTLRLIHSDVIGFPGPSIVASLGVDNVTAEAGASVPEPASLLLIGAGVAAAWARRRVLR
jgi:hypothetical protein